ncbi:MAG: sugar-binding transcriptional regulator [Rhodoglobus sp.]
MTDASKAARREGLARVAEMHFMQHLDQKEIAVRIHTSRSTVSRMLRDAVDLGIVEVIIHHPFPRDQQLEQELVARFGLEEAWVLARDSVTSDDDQAAFGALGARCIGQYLRDGSKLAICWGRATRLVVENLQAVDSVRVHVVQMIGSLGTSNAENDGVELTRLAARRLGGTYALLNAPLVVDDAAFAASLLRQSAIEKVLRAAESADCALVGLGTIDPSSSAIHSAGFMTDAELHEAARLGAVGDVSGILIDALGRTVTSSFSARVIGLSLARLRHIARVVGVAFGADKAQVITAAALGGHVRILVTDRAAARKVLELASTAHVTQPTNLAPGMSTA